MVGFVVYPSVMARDLFITGGQLIDGTGSAPQPDVDIAVSAGRIVALGPRQPQRSEIH